MDSVTVYRDTAGEWRWNRTTSNGRIVSDSGEGYEHHGHAVRMATQVNPGCTVDDTAGEDG